MYLPPILFLAVGHVLYDPVNLLATALFSILIIAKTTFSKNSLNSLNLISKILIAIVFLFGLSTFINEVPLIEALQGNYQRNFGIIYWISLACLVIIFSSSEVNLSYFLNRSLPSLAILATFYGLLQRFNLDPLPWKNEFNAVQLTLGNPNFAGALLGLISVVYLDGIIKGKNYLYKIICFGMWILNAYVSYGTNALQALVILILVSSIYLFLLLKDSSQQITRISVKSFMISTLSLVFMTIFVIFSRMDYLSKVKSRLYFEGNVDARLDYWNNGIQIFINHIFFGVGPDQFQKYAATYRDANQVLRDGAMVVPDKAHNTLIDQFANGGVFVGLLWCAFVVLVSVQPLIVSKLKIDFRTRSHIAVLSAIWFGYIFQALVSPDQLQLSVLGYASAALLFRECHKIRIPKLK